jgi:SAM-dependent methyltransferase
VSGFPAAWLDLRESADRRARNPSLLAFLAHRFAHHDRIEIADLGCGTGSNLRAIAPVLSVRQRWSLVDHDPLLLAAARERLAAWSDGFDNTAPHLELAREGRSLTVDFREADLAADLDIVVPHADLITAAALFDLVSVAWIRAFVSAVAARRAVFYAALTYDGGESWSPPHPSDRAIIAAFLVHQSGDKGFGPAAGPGATGALVEAFRAAGYRVRTAASPWRLGRRDERLIRDRAEGIAAAVRETGRVPPRDVNGWLAARVSGATGRVGHIDLLALPPSRSVRPIRIPHG